MGRGPSIEGRKNAADAQKAKVFTKLVREISLAVKQSGADPAGNPRLRLAMDRALDANMTRDKIEAAVKRAAGEGADAAVEVRYEGYGPGGAAVIVDCVTDNPTRTVAEVRHALSKHGGNLGTSGSVAFQFTQTGQIWLDLRADPAQEDRVLEIGLDAGADDVQTAEGWCEVLTPPAGLESVRKALQAAGLEIADAKVTLRPNTPTVLSGEAAEAFGRLLDRLDELDDVQNVYHNADLPS
ncbi:MAG TPA: YebC/PmpR family DNA-binding transcriptional regulator [Nevskiaceae bacterium]|nr:YebC/PmpR family DNA-binding transcriptional regulator [Nevskiaceae bacterium]